MLLLSFVVGAFHWLNAVSSVVYSFNVGIIVVVVGWLGKTWVRLLELGVVEFIWNTSSHMVGFSLRVSSHWCSA